MMVHDDFEETPGRLINRAARLAQRLGEPAFAALGLATAQLPVLAALKQAGSLTQKQLAELIGTEQPTMAQLLARMERDGLVERIPNAEDRRSSLVSLTRKAKAKAPAAKQILTEGNLLMTKGMSRADVETMMRLLRLLIANLERQLEAKEE